jgi:signal transduction histidine kinase
LKSKILIFISAFFLILSCKKSDPHRKNNSDQVVFDNNYYQNLSNDKKENYLDSVMHYLSIRVNNSKTRNEYLTVAAEYYYLSLNKKSYKSSYKALNLAVASKDTSIIAKSYYYIGDSFENTNRDSSYFYYLKAEKLYEKIKEYEWFGRMKFNKAYLLFYDGNYLECEIEVSKALFYLKNTDKHKLLYSCYNLMGNCLEKLEDYDEALYYHNLAFKVLDVLKENGEDKDVINNYNLASVINICNLYDTKGEYDKSIALLEPLLTSEIKQNWPNEYALIQSNLAYSKMKKGDLTNVKELLNESLEIVNKLNDKTGIVYIKIHLGEFYLLKNDTSTANEYLKDAYESSKSIGNHHELLKSLSILSEISDKRLYYKNLYINVNDSIIKQQRKTRDKYARIEFETSSLEQQNDALVKKNYRNLMISGIIVFALFLLLVTRYIHSKNKELYYIKHQKLADDELADLLNEQQERILLAKEQEKSAIAKELHDGIMNKLYSVRMNLGFFNDKNTDDDVEKRKKYIYNLQEIETEIRSLSHDLNRNTLLDSNDFTDLIKTLVDDCNALGMTRFKFNCTDIESWNSITNVNKINIYRIIQESLFNVHKHAEANLCEVTLAIDGSDKLLLIIKDDGKGFVSNKKSNGIGLQNIHERVSLMKGKIIVNSLPDLGTTLKIFITR